MSLYSHGRDVLGAVAPQRAVLIRVRNVPDVIKAQGGAVGSLIQKYVPDTIDQTVYSKMASQFAQKMREQGIDPDVQVVDTANMKFANESPIWRGAMIATLSVGGLVGLGLLFRRFR